MYAVWVTRHGASDEQGHWHVAGDGVLMAATPGELLEALRWSGTDNAFSYTPKEFTGELPARRVTPPEPARAPMGNFGAIPVRFRTDYDPEHGIAAQPGDVFYVPCASESDDGHCPYWDDCEGKHLYAVCPNGNWWNIDGRASNCTMRGDRQHRCWVRHGDPAAGTLHVDKAGRTCEAGAGSILAGSYHGFLHNGQFTST